MEKLTKQLSILFIHMQNKNAYHNCVAPHRYDYLLVSSRDYCEAPCADRVPKESAKKCQVPPPPSHHLEMKFLGLCFWTDHDIRTSDIQSATSPLPSWKCKVCVFGQILTSGLPSATPPMESWHFWTNLNSLPLDLPNAKLAFLDWTGLQIFKVPCPHPENAKFVLLDRFWP